MPRVARISVCHPGSKHFAKGLCIRCYQRDKKRELCKTDWSRARDRYLKKYGITEAEFQEKLVAQNNKCAICGETPESTLHVDHSHKNKRVRGLLCFRCNAAIGMLRESESVLIKAKQYLEFWSLVCLK